MRASPLLRRSSRKRNSLVANDVFAAAAESGLARRFASRHHFVEVVQHVRHAHGSSKLAHPLPNGNNVCLRVSSKQALDVLHVFGPASNGLHDEQILDTRQTHAQAANIVNLTSAQSASGRIARASISCVIR